jgi:hypothetical protein
MATVYVNNYSGARKRTFYQGDDQAPPAKPNGFDTWLHFTPNNIWISFDSNTDFVNTSKTSEVLDGGTYPVESITFNENTLSTDENDFTSFSTVKTSNLMIGNKGITIFFFLNNVA